MESGRSAWASQPPANVRANPARGASGLWTFSGYADRVGGAPIVLGTGGSIKQGPAGSVLSVSGTGALNRGVLRACGTADKPGAGDFTAWIRFTLRAEAGYGVLARWNTGASISTCDWLLGSNTGIPSTISFGVACGSTAVHAEVAAGWVNGTEYLLVGRRRGTTLNVDRVALANGRPSTAWVSATTTSASVTTINSNSARSLKIGEIDAGASLNASVDALAVGLLPRALSDDEVYRLPYELWSYFSPRRILVPVVASASSASAGELASTLDALTGSVTGSLNLNASSSATLGALTSTATGSLRLNASSSATLAALTASATGSIRLNAALSTSLADVTLSSAATVGNQIDGDLSATLGDVTMAATGSVDITAAMGVTLGDLVLTGIGTLALSASTTATLGTLTCSATGATGDVETWAATSPPIGRKMGTDRRMPQLSASRPSNRSTRTR